MSSHLIASRRTCSANDPIFELNRMAAERAASGDRVINATLGTLLDDDGALIVLPTATRAVRELTPIEGASYAPIVGAPAFLSAVKADLFTSLPALGARAVVASTPGGTGALRHALTVLLEEGQSVLTTSWYWEPYATLAAENGRCVATFTMFTPEGRFNVDALHDALGGLFARQGRALLLLNDPCHNPTGYSMSDDDWARTADAVADFAGRGPVSVVLDMAYAAFSDGGLARPLEHLARMSSAGVLLGFCWSASKTFLQYGQRVGALVVVPPSEEDMPSINAALAFASRGTWSNCNHGGMKAVARLLSDPTLRRTVDDERHAAASVLAERVNIFHGVASSLALRFPRYDGGFFVVVECGRPEDAATLRARGVFVVPIDRALRLALCSVATADIEPLVRHLAAVVNN